MAMIDTLPRPVTAIHKNRIDNIPWHFLSAQFDSLSEQRRLVQSPGISVITPDADASETMHAAKNAMMNERIFQRNFSVSGCLDVSLELISISARMDRPEQ